MFAVTTNGTLVFWFLTEPLKPPEDLRPHTLSNDLDGTASRKSAHYIRHESIAQEKCVVRWVNHGALRHADSFCADGNHLEGHSADDFSLALSATSACRVMVKRISRLSGKGNARRLTAAMAQSLPD